MCARVRRGAEACGVGRVVWGVHMQRRVDSCGDQGGAGVARTSLLPPAHAVPVAIPHSFRVRSPVVAVEEEEPNLRPSSNDALLCRVVEIASVRVIVQPMMRWLWLGGLIMVAGGLIAAWPKRKERLA